MRIIILMIITIIGICKTANGQVLIVGQDFDATTSLTYGNTGGATITGSSGAGDRPASASYSTSTTTAFQINNGTSTVTFADVTGLGSYISKYYEFRLASWSIASTGNGADGADIVTVAISTDGGTSYSNEVRVLGNTNAYWHYSTGTGLASVTYDGNNTPTDYTPAAGGNRTTDGYSTVRISLPDAGTQARLRITMLNNAAGERWSIDDVFLYGTVAGCTAPSISSHPSTSTQTVCNGSAITALSVTAAGTAPTYQWYSNAANSNSGGTLITGATSASYTPDNTLIGTTYYYCIVTGTCGNVTSNVSGAIVVNALPASPAGTITPAANPVCTSTTLSYSAGSATTYWQTSSLGTSTAQNTLTDYTVTTSGTYYVRTNDGTCWSSGEVASAAITINTLPSISSQPSNTSVSAGSNANFSVTASGTSLTYQWYENQGSGWNPLSNGGVYSGVTAATMTLTSVTIGMNGYQYYCTVSGTCAPSVNSSTVTLTVVTTAVGDYRTRASGSWGINTTWEKWNGASWVACGAGDFPDVGTASATVRNGHTVDNDATGTPPWDVKNLTVEAGGKLWDNSFAGANDYIQIYGNIVCDGQIGTPTGDDISFDIAGGTNCTISGTGSFTATRIRKDQNINPSLDVNLTIDMNILLTWNSSSGTVLYNDESSSNYIVTVNAGKTLRGTAPGSNVGNISIDGANFSGPSAANSGGTYTIYGTIDIDGILYAYTNNTTAGRSCNFIIKNGGVFKCRYVVAAASGTQGNSLTIENGGKLNIFGSVDTITATLNDTTWRNFSTTNNTYDFQPGSIVEYSGARGQRIHGHSNYKNVIISGGGLKTLGLDVTVAETLTLTSGIVQTNAFKMIMTSTTASDLIHTVGSASFINGNFRRYIATNTSTYRLPLGYSNASTGYHPANFLNGNITGVTYLDTYVNSITEAGNNIDSRIVTTQQAEPIVDVVNTAEWNITPNAAPSGGNYGVDLYVVNMAGLTDDQFFVVKRDNASTDYADWDTFDASTNVPVATTAGRITSGGAGFATRNFYTAFSKFAIGKVNNIVLAMQVVNFTATSKANYTSLSWKTIEEENLMYFEVEKSKDALNYISIGTVVSNISRKNNTYELIDEISNEGITYYKLYSVDQNGVRKYHQTITLNSIDATNGYDIVYSADAVSINFNEVSAATQVNILNSAGQQIRSFNSEQIQQGKLVLNNVEFAKGVYIIQIIQTNKVLNNKIIIY